MRRTERALATLEQHPSIEVRLYNPFQLRSWGALGNAAGVQETGSEAYQAAWYTKLIDYALCDADVTKVNVFKLVDETSLLGWQSGLFYVGYVPKLSAAAFPAELERTSRMCPTGDAAWFSPSSQPASDGGAGLARQLARKAVVALRAASGVR